jgi:hypothetical protein
MIILVATCNIFPVYPENYRAVVAHIIRKVF